MDLTQNWVGRLDRSFQQIAASLLGRLTQNAPEITDHSDTNPLIINLKMFAGIGEVINLYIDSKSREAFWGVARRYTSLVKLSKIIDYHIKAKGYSTATILFTVVDGSGNAIIAPTDLIIPKGTILNSINAAITFNVLEDVIIPRGFSSAYGTVGQYDEVNNLILGNTTGTANQSIGISDNYVNNSMRVTIAGQEWTEYNSFGLMFPTTKGFVVDIDEDGNAAITFGDGTNGAIPPSGQTIFGSYKDTLGSSGNVPPGTISVFVTGLTLPVGISIAASNPDYASGGSDFESMEEIRTRGPRSLRSMDRAVTYQDYIDVAMQVVGVSAAEVSYCCGKYVDLYVVPKGRGVATAALISKVQDYIDCRKMITTMVDVKPAGVSRIWIQANIIGKPLANATQIQAEVLNALDDNFGQGVAKINQPVSLTNIIALLEGLPSVDTAEIQKVKVEPYARPVNDTLNTLGITFIDLPTGNTRFTYTLIYQSGTNSFQVFKAGIFMATLAIGAVFTDPGVLSFQVNAGVYTNNDKWDLTSFPSYPEIFPTTIINIDDFSAPVVDVSPFIDDNTPRTIFSNITYQTTQPTSNCLPPC